MRIPSPSSRTPRRRRWGAPVRRALFPCRPRWDRRWLSLGSGPSSQARSAAGTGADGRARTR